MGSNSDTMQVIILYIYSIYTVAVIWSLSLNHSHPDDHLEVSGLSHSFTFYSVDTVIIQVIKSIGLISNPRWDVHVFLYFKTI